MSKITIPDYWTAHEARAVFEFLDELKEHIGAVYGTQIVELCRVEDARILVAIAPLAVGEGIDGEVEEAVDLEFMPAELAGRRQGAVGGRRFGRRGEDACSGGGESKLAASHSGIICGRFCLAALC